MTSPSSQRRNDILTILDEADLMHTKPEDSVPIPEMSHMTLSVSASPSTWTESHDSSLSYNVGDLSELAMRTRKEYDMLLFHWRYVFGSDWSRSLMISDADYATKNLNEVVQLSDCLNLHNFYLYQQYNNRLDGIIDLHFVFDQVKMHRHSDRFFNFKSFAAEMLLVSYKLDLWPFYDTRPLPRDFHVWRNMVQEKIGHYLRNTLCLDANEYRAVIQNVFGIQTKRNRIGNIYWTTVPVSERIYTINLLHEDKSHPQDVAIRCDPNTYWTVNPMIGSNKDNKILDQLLQSYRLRYGIQCQGGGHSQIQQKQDRRWPRSYRGYDGKAKEEMTLQQRSNSNDAQMIGTAFYNQPTQPHNVDAVNRREMERLNGYGLNPNAVEFQMRRNYGFYN